MKYYNNEIEIESFFILFGATKKSIELVIFFSNKYIKKTFFYEKN